MKVHKETYYNDEFFKSIKRGRIFERKKKRIQTNLR